MTAALNHAYRVVDRQIYAAVRDDPWIRSTFAPCEQRTTNRIDWSYTGLYLYGRRTYLELFDEGPQGPAGHAGIALSVGKGETAAVADAWTAACGRARTALVERPPDVEDTRPGANEQPGVAWFHLACAEPDRRDGLHLWSMEYHPGFLAGWYPQLTPARTIDPGDVLDRYVARITRQTRGAFLFDEVTGIDLSLSGEAFAFLRAQLAAITRLDQTADTLTAALGMTTIRAVVSSEPRGLTTLSCSLRQDVASQVRSFGASTLTIDGRSAAWSFDR